MAQIARIVSIKHNHIPGKYTIGNALAENGLGTYPGISKTVIPIKDKAGRYKTGLDEKAFYISQIRDKKAQKAEIEKVRERRERLENATGFISDPKDPDHTGLGALSPYYAGVYGMNIYEGGRYRKVDLPSNETAHRVKLIDGINTFNFDTPSQEVTYWWVIQWDYLIASSKEALDSGRAKAGVLFYVENAEEEANLTYNKMKKVNDAAKALEVMSLDKRKKVGRLIGLPITENDKEEIVYIEINKFLKLPEVKIGDYQGQYPVDVFNKIANMDATLLDVSDLVTKAIKHRILNVKANIVYDGNQILASTKQDLINSLCLDSKQEERMALDIRVADKLKMSV